MDEDEGEIPEYVFRTLCSMGKDKKCEWDRLSGLVLNYYREHIDSRFHARNKSLEKNLKIAGVDLEELAFVINCTLKGHTGRIKMLGPEQLCRFLSGKQFLAEDLPSVNIHPLILDDIVLDSLKTVQVGTCSS